MFSAKRLLGMRWMQKTIGIAVAEFLRLVWKTNRFVIEPAGLFDELDRDFPIILTMWHGQHFMTPFVKRPHRRATVLISRHRDGEINAIAANWLNIETVRGSGAVGNEAIRKGGAIGFRNLLAAIEDGSGVALTADVPKVSRVCGLGVVKLASMSGRTIYPVAIATSRRITLKNWDRSAVSLPFGRGAMVFGPRVRVPADADDTALETARRAVEDSLNAATARAYALVDGDGEPVRA